MGKRFPIIKSKSGVQPLAAVGTTFAVLQCDEGATRKSGPRSRSSRTVFDVLLFVTARSVRPVLRLGVPFPVAAACCCARAGARADLLPGAPASRNCWQQQPPRVGRWMNASPRRQASPWEQRPCSARQLAFRGTALPVEQSLGVPAPVGRRTDEATRPAPGDRWRKNERARLAVNAAS